jgi:hypothetical protein
MTLGSKVIGIIAAVAVGAIALPALAAVHGQPLPPAPPSSPNWTALNGAVNARLMSCTRARDHLCETEVSAQASSSESEVETYFNLYYLAQSHYRAETADRNALAKQLNADCKKLKAHHLTCA